MTTASQPAPTDHRQPRPAITFRVTCDWHRACAPPVNAMRMLLKVLLRTFNARCLSCDFTEGPGDGE